MSTVAPSTQLLLVSLTLILAALGVATAWRRKSQAGGEEAMSGKPPPGPLAGGLDVSPVDLETGAPLAGRRVEIVAIPSRAGEFARALGVGVTDAAGLGQIAPAADARPSGYVPAVPGACRVVVVVAPEDEMIPMEAVITTYPALAVTPGAAAGTALRVPWAEIAERMREAGVDEVRDLARGLGDSGPAGIFADLPAATRRHALIELHARFLDPAAVLASRLAAPDSWPLLHDPAARAAWIDGFALALDVDDVRVALGEAIGKLESFSSLRNVDWPIDLDAMAAGRLGEALCVAQPGLTVEALLREPAAREAPPADHARIARRPFPAASLLARGAAGGRSAGSPALVGRLLAWLDREHPSAAEAARAQRALEAAPSPPEAAEAASNGGARPSQTGIGAHMALAVDDLATLRLLARGPLVPEVLLPWIDGVLAPTEIGALVETTAERRTSWLRGVALPLESARRALAAGAAVDAARVAALALGVSPLPDEVRFGATPGASGATPGAIGHPVERRALELLLGEAWLARAERLAATGVEAGLAAARAHRRAVLALHGVEVAAVSPGKGLFEVPRVRFRAVAMEPMVEMQVCRAATGLGDELGLDLDDEARLRARAERAAAEFEYLIATLAG